jgi:site-specific recombinase XerD
MRSTFRLLFYINRNKVKSDGTTAVMCRISIDGKNSVLTTGIYCHPDNWDAKKGVIKTERNNNRLTAFRGRMEQAYEHLLKELGVVGSELLKNTVTGVNSVPIHLLEAGEVERERLRIRSQEINSTSTYRQSGSTQTKLRDFIRSRGMEDIAFGDITGEFGESFKLFLKRDMGYKSSHINHCLCWLNRLIYIAVDREIIRVNPVEKVSYEKAEPLKLRHINKSELKRIMEHPIHIPALELARRTFIFSCFTALAYVDVCRLYPHHIGKTAEGRLYIRKQRAKTNVEAFIPLHPVAEQILLLYNTTDDSKPVFPLAGKDAVWHEIHQIGASAGIRESLSYYMARHSCAMLMLSCGLSIESISKMMGHTNISSTQIYAKVTDTKISEDMDRLMVRRKKNGSQASR